MIFRLIQTLMLSSMLLILCPAHAFRVTAQSWLVADSVTGRIIDGENEQQIRSIASITKIVSSMVVLDASQDLTHVIKPYTRRELILLSLVRSDNRAAHTLCERFPGGVTACVAAMNAKAQELGMKDTRFVDATGLGVGNVSTARDLISLVQAARKYPLIVEASKMAQVKIQLRKQWLIFNNTNPSIGKRYDIEISKTGWIKASGGCVVLMMDTDIGSRIVIVLGSQSTLTRIPEAEFLLDWARDEPNTTPMFGF